MPSTSRAQQRAAQMAEHASPAEIAKAGPAVQQMAKSMSHAQLHEFSVGSEKGKPEHVKHHHKEHKRGENLQGRQPKERGK
jgi:hypothetical protein